MGYYCNITGHRARNVNVELHVRKQGRVSKLQLLPPADRRNAGRRVDTSVRSSGRKISNR